MSFLAPLFFLALAVWTAIDALQRGGRRRILLASLAVFLAFFSKYSSAAASSSAIGYLLLIGTNDVRNSSSAAWRLTARFTGHGSSARRLIPGTTPTVDTVIDRAEMPMTSIIRRSASRTRS